MWALATSLAEYEGVAGFYLLSGPEAVMKGLIALVASIVIASFGWDAANKAGYVRHQRATPVWIKGEWLVGEYRHCVMQTAQLDYVEDPTTYPRLFCGYNAESFNDFAGNLPVGEDAWWQISRYFHVLPVGYFGRLKRTERFVGWQCQRETAAITCKALD